MKRYCIGLFLLFSVASIHATEIGERDSIGFNVLFNKSMFQSNSPDSLIREKHKKTFFHRVGDVFTKFFREFNVTDSSYIEPQHYNYTVMLQNTNTYEEYTLSSKEGQRISFAPDPHSASDLIWVGAGCSLVTLSTSNISMQVLNIPIRKSLT